MNSSDTPKEYTFRKVDLDWEKPLREFSNKRQRGILKTKEEGWDHVISSTKHFAFAGFFFGAAAIAFKGVKQTSLYTVTRKALIGNYKKTAIETANTVLKPTFLFGSLGFTYSFCQNQIEDYRKKNDLWNGVYASLPLSVLYSAVTKRSFFHFFGFALIINYFFDDSSLPGLTHEQNRLDNINGTKIKELN